MVVASSANGTVGGTVTLTASCSGTPTSWAWTGCESTTNTCTASATASGTVWYSVVATNSKGASEPAGVSVTWRMNTPPTCTLSASEPMPTLGSTVVLTATCTGAVDYAWTGCASTASTCVPASPAAAGPVTYGVTATNSSGTSAPASVTVSWQPSLDLCAPYADRIDYQMPWNAVNDNGTGINPLHTNDHGGMRPQTVVVVRFTVPASAPMTWTVPQSRVDVSEYQGAPTARHVTLATRPCDFRAVDATGMSGPLAQANGTTAAVNWTANLATPLAGYVNLRAGVTYYLNVRNWDSGTNMASCTGTTCDALVGFTWPR